MWESFCRAVGDDTLISLSAGCLGCLGLSSQCWLCTAGLWVFLFFLYLFIFFTCSLCIVFIHSFFFFFQCAFILSFCLSFFAAFYHSHLLFSHFLCFFLSHSLFFFLSLSHLSLSFFFLYISPSMFLLILCFFLLLFFVSFSTTLSLSLGLSLSLSHSYFVLLRPSKLLPQTYLGLPVTRTLCDCHDAHGVFGTSTTYIAQLPGHSRPNGAGTFARFRQASRTLSTMRPLCRARSPAAAHRMGGLGLASCRRCRPVSYSTSLSPNHPGTLHWLS